MECEIDIVGVDTIRHRDLKNLVLELVVGRLTSLPD